MKGRKGIILFFLISTLIAAPFTILRANAQEEKNVYGPKSDIKENNSIAILTKIDDNGKETIKLLKEIRDLLKEQNKKLEMK